MRKYGVTMPIAGFVYKEVEAENEKDALEKFWDEGWTDDDIEELDGYEKICSGNVCHVTPSRVSVEEVDE